MITRNIVWALILFFVQPVFIVGLLYALWNRNKRVKYVRKNYRMNFNRSSFELTDFFLKGLLPGLVLSILSLVVGIPLTIEWYLVYQVVAIVLLLIGGSRFIHPLFTFSLSSIVLFVFDRIGQVLPMGGWLEQISNQNLMTLNFEIENVSLLFLNGLLFTALILLATTYAMNDTDHNKVYPILRSSKRGKTVVKYQNKSLWVLPLAVVVPGEVIEPFADWWPFLNIGGEQFAILLLPILIGFHYTNSTQLLEEATLKMKNDFRIVALLIFALCVLSYFYPGIRIWAVGVTLIGGLFVLYRHRKRENRWSFKYGPAVEGIRIIAIRPNSPAERMNLSIGEIITHINDQEVHTKDEFYEVMTYNRSYIKMRIKRNDGEIVIKETPLYDDDFNNLGLLIL